MIESKLPNVKTTIFTQMSALAAQHNAVNLSQGFPNFEVDGQLLSNIKQGVDEGENQYAPMPGDALLRENISKKYFDIYGAQYNPNSQITITAGATQAIFTAIACSVSKGDEVLIFDPSYDCYAPTVELFGGIPVRLELTFPEYSINWNEVSSKLSDKTKLVVINTPNNPTGTVLSQNDISELNKLVEQHNFLVLSDEVYEHIIFDGAQHESVCRYSSLKERSFIVGSFGKTFHVTGWKIGYCMAPEAMMREFNKVHQFNVFCVNRPAQYAIAKQLNNPENYLHLGQFYQKKRDLFIDLIQSSRFKILPCKGTYFLLLDYSNISEEADVDFAIRLTKEYGLATIPISVFYEQKTDHKVVRVCFAKDDETLKKAAKIICSI